MGIAIPKGATQLILRKTKKNICLVVFSSLKVRQTDRPTDRPTDRQTADRQTDRPTGRKTDRQTGSLQKTNRQTADGQT